MNAGTVHDVLLLGAAGSIGQFVARELAGRGLSVQLAGRRLEPLAGLAGELAAIGIAVDSVSVDVTDAAAMHALVRGAFGTGATVLNFGGARRSMLPGPAGDLEVARLASGAANVSAYFGDPAQRADGDGFSYAYAEVVAESGRPLAAQAGVSDGIRAGAAFAAEVALRLLAGAPAGAWTPGRLFGEELFPAVTGATVTPLSGGPV
jgi:short subunit dehydrogenase-like uncharacterized protein